MNPFAMKMTMISTMMATMSHITHMGTMPKNDSIVTYPFFYMRKRTIAVEMLLLIVARTARRCKRR